ncbi:MAG: hypothetical protein NT133_13825 [Alphaproteobacteria bacterium]|nr:hypothetical protein [Alphaproteobacteria bacterium]
MRRALERIGSKTPREQRAPQASFSSTPTGRGSQDGPKRRFVRDGEVPVMVVTGTRSADAPVQRRGSGGPANEQLEAAQTALRLERNAHEAAERALREAQATIQDLRTKLGHLSMARDEAIETAKRSDATHAAMASELDALKFRLATEVSGRARAERAAQSVGQPTEPDAATAPAPPAAEPAPRRRGRPPKSEARPAAEAVPKRKPGRPRIEREPEPVKWWLPKRGRPTSK